MSFSKPRGKPRGNGRGRVERTCGTYLLKNKGGGGRGESQFWETKWKEWGKTKKRRRTEEKQRRGNEEGTKEEAEKNERSYSRSKDAALTRHLLPIIDSNEAGEDEALSTLSQKGIADTMAYLQSEGRLLRAEHNLLGEAFLVMSSTVGIQQQQEVLVWLLEPLNKQWTQIEWQNVYLSDPAGHIRLCSDTSFMWSLFHTMTFFEKSLKRSGFRKNNLNVQAGSLGMPPHPMASHLAWIL